MTESSENWDYCQIEFKLRYKGEDLERTGTRIMWLLFQARAMGEKRSYVAGKSSEIPIAANVIGASFVPQKNNVGYANVYQDLLLKLQKDGWELLPDEGGEWWGKRLRRPTRQVGHNLRFLSKSRKVA